MKGEVVPYNRLFTKELLFFSFWRTSCWIRSNFASKPATRSMSFLFPDFPFWRFAFRGTFSFSSFVPHLPFAHCYGCFVFHLPFANRYGCFVLLLPLGYVASVLNSSRGGPHIFGHLGKLSLESHYLCLSVAWSSCAIVDIGIFFCSLEIGVGGTCGHLWGFLFMRDDKSFPHTVPNCYNSFLPV